MSRSMTPKENFMAVLNGEIPESVLQYFMGMPTGVCEHDMVRSIAPKLWENNSHAPGGGKDMWGVPYVQNEETGFASIPEPNNFLLDDITKWRDVIKTPEVFDIDWEHQAAVDWEKSGIDRTQTAVYCGANLMPFQQLVAFMGFNDTLCALIEEPEECKALLNYMVDFLEPYLEKTLDYYKPDYYYMLDDTASKYNPFFSMAIYEDVFLPIYHRLAKPAIDRGLPIGFHNCGRCEDQLQHMTEFGVKFWDPAQPGQNDLDGIKQKFGRNLAIVGAWETQTMFDDWPNTPEDEIIQSIHDTIDRYAPNGGYMFEGMPLSKAGDEKSKYLQDLITRTANEYGDHWYEKH